MNSSGRHGRGSNQYRNAGPSVAPRRTRTYAAVYAAVTEPPAPDTEVDIGQPCPVTYRDGAWTKKRCSHPQCRQALQRARKLGEVLDDPVLTARWVNAGITSRQQLRYWDGKYFEMEPEALAPWIGAGLRPYDAYAAIKAGWDDPTEVKTWVDATMSVSSALGFRKAGCSLEEADRWTRAGVDGFRVPQALTSGHTPESYTQFLRDAGIVPKQRWEGWIGLPYLSYGDPVVAGRWYRTGIPSHDQPVWAGWEPEAAAEWYRIVDDPDDAADLVAHGVTAQEMSDLVAAVPSLRQPGATERSRERARDYLRVIRTQGVDTARQWMELGCDSSVVVGAAQWGLLPSDIHEARRSGETTVDVDGMHVTARWQNGRTRWVIESPDGHDLDAERAAAAFSGQTPRWDIVKQAAQRLAKHTLTPGDALRTVADNPAVQMGHQVRRQWRESPLCQLPEGVHPDRVTPYQRRRMARLALGLLPDPS